MTARATKINLPYLEDSFTDCMWDLHWKTLGGACQDKEEQETQPSDVKLGVRIRKLRKMRFVNQALRSDNIFLFLWLHPAVIRG